MSAGIRIRMFRTGFGDCFLMSLGPKGSMHHVLIDFGAHMHGEIGTMDEVMDEIEIATQKQLDLVVSTHFHRDHISGFGQFAQRFAQFDRIGAVWMPWTDNPNDKKTAALEKKQLMLYDKLERHLLQSKAASPQAQAALNALQNLRGNESAKSALRSGFGKVRPQYLKPPKKLLNVAGIAGLSAQILGPPSDTSFFSRMDPPSDQRFLAMPGDSSGEIHPFRYWELKETDPDFAAIGDTQPRVPPNDMSTLLASADAPADRLALALDNVRNNTSLVILFRFGGKAMLFPGDAQWGNWQSWIGTDDATQLLGDLDFLKIAHHGSHNATPRGVVGALRAHGLSAMVSTQVKPFPTIPRKPLLEAVETHCDGGVVVRSDWVTVKKAPAGPKPMPQLPASFETGKLWIDCIL